MLGARLASYLGLPTTPIALVHVSEEPIRFIPELCMDLPRHRIPCQPGLQFGSSFPGDPRRLTLLDFLPDPLLRQVDNLHDFAGMLVFDKWTCNTNGRQTLFRRDTQQVPGNGHASYKTFMIDQGFCFHAGEWNFPDAPLRGLYARNQVYEGVTGVTPFGPWVERLQNHFTERSLHYCTEIWKQAGLWLKIQKRCRWRSSRFLVIRCESTMGTGRMAPGNLCRR